MYANRPTEGEREERIVPTEVAISSRTLLHHPAVDPQPAWSIFRLTQRAQAFRNVYIDTPSV